MYEIWIAAQYMIDAGVKAQRIYHNLIGNVHVHSNNVDTTQNIEQPKLQNDPNEKIISRILAIFKKEFKEQMAYKHFELSSFNLTHLVDQLIISHVINEIDEKITQDKFNLNISPEEFIAIKNKALSRLITEYNIPIVYPESIVQQSADLVENTKALADKLNKVPPQKNSKLEAEFNEVVKKLEDFAEQIIETVGVISVSITAANTQGERVILPPGTNLRNAIEDGVEQNIADLATSVTQSIGKPIKERLTTSTIKYSDQEKYEILKHNKAPQIIKEHLDQLLLEFPSIYQQNAVSAYITQKAIDLNILSPEIAKLINKTVEDSINNRTAGQKIADLAFFMSTELEDNMKSTLEGRQILWQEDFNKKLGNIDEEFAKIEARGLIKHSQVTYTNRKNEKREISPELLEVAKDILLGR